MTIWAFFICAHPGTQGPGESAEHYGGRSPQVGLHRQHGSDLQYQCGWLSCDTEPTHRATPSIRGDTGNLAHATAMHYNRTMHGQITVVAIVPVLFGFLGVG